MCPLLRDFTVFHNYNLLDTFELHSPTHTLVLTVQAESGNLNLKATGMLKTESWTRYLTSRSNKVNRGGQATSEQFQPFLGMSWTRNIGVHLILQYRHHTWISVTLEQFPKCYVEISYQPFPIQMGSVILIDHTVLQVESTPSNLVLGLFFPRPTLK